MRAAIEDNLILPADRIDVEQRCREGLRATPDQRLTLLLLADMKRGSVEIKPEIAADLRMAGGQCIAPEILADTHADAPAIDLEHHILPAAGGEIALLIEDAVVGQLLFVVTADDAAVLCQKEAVAQGGAIAARRTEDDTALTAGRDHR